jgi:hypothetical protein
MDLPDHSFDVGCEDTEVFLATKCLDRNKNENNLPTVFECDIFRYTTYKKYNLDRHVKSVHQTVFGLPKDSSTPEPKSKKKHVCDQCGKEFISAFGLKLHTKDKHLHIYKHKCTVCDKGFNQAIQFKHHCAQHLEFAILKCEKCGKSLKGHGSLKRHQVLACEKSPGHKGEVFSCDDCFKEFASKDRLKSHQKGMHGPERYVCARCGKKYRWRSCLKKHQQLCK